ncbi:MAG TPA: HAD family phosphatase [Sphingobium sp.]|uniref:HAD family hydrolase n=1 Tax=Sphingobium sp. TaxID=1912891 RepID=UPI002ED286D7
MTLPRRPAAIVFDMDGVLFDTEKLYRHALFAAAEEGGHAMTEALFLQMIGSPWPTNRALLLAHLGADFPADELRDAAHRKLHDAMAAGSYLKPGVLELLDTLDALDLPRAIATSSSHDAVNSNLLAHEMVGRFHHIVAHGDYANGKPAPDPFLTAAARIGVDPALCIALEDSHHGVRSASAAGMMTIMVPDLLAPTEEIRGLCTHIATDLHEVAILVRATMPDA